MTFEHEFDARVFECIKNNAKGQAKHCIRSAVRHIDKAWKIKDIDPEMAVFRAITAEEEAATAIFLLLKEKKYNNADKIKFKKHIYKQALEPFLYSFRKFVDNVSKSPYFILGDKVSFSLDGDGYKQMLGISLYHNNQLLSFSPPLGFQISLDGKEYYFENEIREVSGGSTTDEVIKYIQAIANRRNELLYAQPSGVPRITDGVDAHLKKRRRVVVRLMYIFALIYPHKENAIFVQQALNGFLKMMGEVELILND